MFSFANFPKNLIQKLKEKCKIRDDDLSSRFKECKEASERRSLKLNRLEAFLLKLVIPFIRIAHCPRGPYFKVKGDLILISSDIEKSLSKILPLEQSLIPVAFKRRLAYKGSFIEEIIEKEKLKIYFSWFKENNHLFKDFELNPDLIEEFEMKSCEASKIFQCDTKTEANPIQDSEEESEEVDLSDNEDTILKRFNIDPHQPPENARNQNNSSIFLNKYGEDTNLPTVANKFANIVVDYERSRNIKSNKVEDFDIEDDLEYLNKSSQMIYYSSEEEGKLGA